MRVAFLSVSAQMGGSEVMLVEIIRAVRRAQPSWALDLVVPGAGPLSATAAAAGASVTIVPLPGALRRLGEWGARGGGLLRLVPRLVRAALDVPRYQRALTRALADIRPDVIHSNGFKAHIVAARMRRGGAALVWHMHEYVSRRPLARVLVRRYAARCDMVIANSASVADDFRQVAGRPSVRVIHNAVDLARFDGTGPSADLDALSSMPAPPAGTVRVGLVATFSRWKGHATFLHAIASLPASLPLRAYIIGGALYDTAGSQHSLRELKALATSLGLDGRVGFTGFVDAPADAMRALDVVVHASTEPEAFGLVIAEGMACGRAVVTSGSGGAAELVTSGSDALTHRAGDADDLARCIRDLVGDTALRTRIGARARSRALVQFDARRLATEFTESYEMAMARRAAQ